MSKSDLGISSVILILDLRSSLCKQIRFPNQISFSAFKSSLAIRSSGKNAETMKPENIVDIVRVF